MCSREADLDSWLSSKEHHQFFSSLKAQQDFVAEVRRRKVAQRTPCIESEQVVRILVQESEMTCVGETSLPINCGKTKE